MLDELTMHLEDVYAGALDEGAGADAARARALAALEESAFSMLRRHASRSPERRQAQHADSLARASGGRSLNVLSAIRLAGRQFLKHPTFALVTVLVSARDLCHHRLHGRRLGALRLLYAEPERPHVGHQHRKGTRTRSDLPVNFMDHRARPSSRTRRRGGGPA